MLRHFKKVAVDTETKDTDSSIRSVASIDSLQQQQKAAMTKQHANGSLHEAAPGKHHIRDLSIAATDSTSASSGPTEAPVGGSYEGGPAVRRISETPADDENDVNNSLSYSDAEASTPGSHVMNVTDSSAPDFRITTESTLSPRDVFEEGDELLHQDYFYSDIASPDPPKSRDVLASPASASLDTPPTVIASYGGSELLQIALPPAARAAASPQSTNRSPLSYTLSDSASTTPASAAGERLTGGGKQRPVLYSAIGSLEDMSGVQSFSRLYNKNVVKKFEFPSTQLLPPPNQTARRPKSRSRSSPLAAKPEVAETQPVVSAAGDLAEFMVPPPPAKDKKKPSNLKNKSDESTSKKVTISDDTPKKPKKKKGPTEMFRPSSDAYTPRMGKKVIKYKPAEMRTPVEKMASPLGPINRPNFKDALRRVAMIIHQHVVKIERRWETKNFLPDDGLFLESMRETFSEERYVTPKYRCTMVRVPMARAGMVYGLKRIREKYQIPSESEIYDFAHRLFKTVQLSSECSIVCLIYVERLMENAKVPLLPDTWRPIFMCGLLLASKVWQDLSSWNIEFASVYPQFSLDAINRLELQFLRLVKWDLYISSSAYAKYYFALRSLVEKSDFRQRYNRMVGGVDSVQALEALKIEKRSSMVKEEALSQLSRSM